LPKFEGGLGANFHTPDAGRSGRNRFRAGLEVVKRGAAVRLTATLEEAFSSSTVLSIPYKLVPLLP
jgi:hypothetical protein